MVAGWRAANKEPCVRRSPSEPIMATNQSDISPSILAPSSDRRQESTADPSPKSASGSPKIFVPTRRKRKQPVHRSVAASQARFGSNVAVSSADLLSVNAKHHNRLISVVVHEQNQTKGSEVAKTGIGNKKNTNNNININNNNNNKNNNNYILDCDEAILTEKNHLTTPTIEAGDSMPLNSDNINREGDVTVVVLKSEDNVSDEDLSLSGVHSGDSVMMKKVMPGTQEQKSEAVSKRSSVGRKKKKKKKSKKKVSDGVRGASEYRLPIVTRSKKSRSAGAGHSVSSEEPDGSSTQRESEGRGKELDGLSSSNVVLLCRDEAAKVTPRDEPEESPSPEGGDELVAGGGVTVTSTPPSVAKRKLLANLTREEIDILSMFDEVEVSDPDQSNSASVKERSSPLSDKQDLADGASALQSGGAVNESQSKVVVSQQQRSGNEAKTLLDKNQVGDLEGGERRARRGTNKRKVCGELAKDDECGKQEEELHRDASRKGKKQKKARRRIMPEEAVRGTAERNLAERMTTRIKTRSSKDDTLDSSRSASHVSEEGEVTKSEVDTPVRSSRLRSRIAKEKTRTRKNKEDKTEETVSTTVVDSRQVKKYSCEFCSYAALSASHIIVHTRTHTGDRPFKCKVCKKGFIQQSALRVHLRIHSNARPYKCCYCSSGFRTSGHLSDHLRIHTGERPYMCIKCRKTFRISSHLHAHIKIHNNDRAYKCRICDKAFIQSSQLRIHEKTHNWDAEAVHVCKLCQKRFLLPWNLQLHMRAVHSQGHKPYKCDKCEKSFTIKAYLARHKKSMHGSLKLMRTSCPVCGKHLSKFSMHRHMLTHATEKKYSCKICSKGFNFSQNLLVHLRVHTKDMSYHCPVCQVVFPDLTQMRQHLKKQHRVDPWDKTFWCDTCHKCFFSKGMLSRHHKEVHTVQRPYACDVCGKSFKNERNLKQHLRGHDKTTFIQCKFCDKSFSQRGNLKIHVRTVHKKIKDFSCETCRADFATKRNLLQHMRTHTGEKPFKCRYCTKQFTQGSSRSRHEMIHTGEKPFKCDVCQKGFVQKIHLTGHMRTHRMERCPFCDKVISDKASAGAHLGIHLGRDRYRCPSCDAGFGDEETFVKHGEAVCHLDKVVVSEIQKAAAGLERTGLQRVKSASENRQRTGGKKRPKNAKTKAAASAAKKKRSSRMEEKRVTRSEVSGGVQSSEDEAVTAGKQSTSLGGTDDGSKNNNGSDEHSNNNNNNNKMNMVKMQHVDGCEPLDLSIDQNSNQLKGASPTTALQKIGSHTEIVLQQT